jgi:hypothetical protein
VRTLGIIVASIVLPALLPIVIVAAMTRHAEPLEPPSGHSTALYWADRLFASKAEFAVWLENRGVSYRQWVARHPGASPWERRAAPTATAGRAASMDRRANEERPFGDRLRSWLGAVRSAAVPAAVVLLAGLLVALLARSRRTLAAFVREALEATRALAERVGRARVRPALAVAGTPPTSPVAVVHRRTEPIAPERAPTPRRLRPVYRTVERATAPAAPAQRLRVPPARPVPDPSLQAVAPERAVAAEEGHADHAGTCTIAVWHGYVRSRFYARVSDPDGETRTIAESPPFRRKGYVPEPLPDAVKAHETLLDLLRSEGWSPVGDLGPWYTTRLEPPGR